MCIPFFKTVCKVFLWDCHQLSRGIPLDLVHDLKSLSVVTFIWGKPERQIWIVVKWFALPWWSIYLLALLGIQDPSVASYYEMSNSPGLSVPAWTVSSPLFGNQLTSIQINELGLKIFKMACCIPDVFCMLIFIRINIFQWSAYELKFCFNICIFRMWWFTCLRAAKNMCKVRNLIWLCGTLC